MDETKIYINDFEYKEAKRVRATRKNRMQKNEYSICSLWNNFNRSNMCIIVVPEGKEKEQETGNLSEKIVKDMQVQEAENPKQDRYKEAHSKTIIIKMSKVKDRERILNAAREKKLVTCRGVPISLC